MSPDHATHPPALADAIARGFAPAAAPEWDLFGHGGSDTPPARIALTLHGGSWKDVGRESMAAMHDAVDRWLARGWAVLNVTYRPYQRCLGDVLAFHDALRAWAGPETVVALHGSSAGGHLALMCAILRDGVAMVVGEGPVTDPAALDGFDRARGVRDEALRAFGADLSVVSVVGRAGDLGSTRVLLGTSAGDDVTPPAQIERLRAELPATVTSVVLASGDQDFTHAPVSAMGLDAFHQLEDAMAASVAGATPTR